MSADRIAVLEEQVRQLKGHLGVDVARADVVRVMGELRLRCSEARILLALYRARGWLPAERLELALPDSDTRDLRVIKVHICRIRKILGRDAVLNMVGVGYTLGAPGILACKRALAAGGDA